MESSTNCKTKKESANNNSSTFFSLCKDLNYEMTDKKFVLILLQIEKKNYKKYSLKKSKINYKSKKMTNVAPQSISN